MDVCVCCGSYVPEGSQVCWACINQYARKARKSVREWATTLTISALTQETKGGEQCRTMK